MNIRPGGFTVAVSLARICNLARFSLLYPYKDHNSAKNATLHASVVADFAVLWLKRVNGRTRCGDRRTRCGPSALKNAQNKGLHEALQEVGSQILRGASMLGFSVEIPGFESVFWNGSRFSECERKICAGDLKIQKRDLKFYGLPAPPRECPTWFYFDLKIFRNSRFSIVKLLVISGCAILNLRPDFPWGKIDNFDWYVSVLEKCTLWVSTNFLKILKIATSDFRWF